MGKKFPESLLMSTLAVCVVGAYKLAPLNLNYFPENGNNRVPHRFLVLFKTWKVLCKLLKGEMTYWHHIDNTWYHIIKLIETGVVAVST